MSHNKPTEIDIRNAREHFRLLEVKLQDISNQLSLKTEERNSLVKVIEELLEEKESITVFVENKKQELISFVEELNNKEQALIEREEIIDQREKNVIALEVSKKHQLRQEQERFSKELKDTKDRHIEFVNKLIDLHNDINSLATISSELSDDINNKSTESRNLDQVIEDKESAISELENNYMKSSRKIESDLSELNLKLIDEKKRLKYPLINLEHRESVVAQKEKNINIRELRLGRMLNKIKKNKQYLK